MEIVRYYLSIIKISRAGSSMIIVNLTIIQFDELSNPQIYSFAIFSVRAVLLA